MPPAIWPAGCREVVYELRAQGMTTREIETALTERFPQTHTPDHNTVARWLTDPDATALVRQSETRLRAAYVAGAQDVVPDIFRGIQSALEGERTAQVRDLSQALAAVTRGIVRDQLEVTTQSAPDDDRELANLLTRHGVKLSRNPA